MEKNKIAIIGFGSIGKRHARNIKKNFNFFKILIITSLKTRLFKTNNNIEFLKEFNPSHIIIANETFKHFQTLKFIEKNLRNIDVLIEKPLFEKIYTIKNFNNNYYVAYNFRFHPMLKFLKKKIRYIFPTNIEIICKSYLPNWRKRDYTKTYSQSDKLGGGVLFELSHEIDYAQYLFGSLNIEYKKVKKISNLNLQTTDSALFIASNDVFKNILFNLSICSLNETRIIIIESNNKTYYCDFLNKYINVIYKDKVEKINFKNFEMKHTYQNELKSFLTNKKNLCNYDDAFNTLKFINKLKRK